MKAQKTERMKNIVRKAGKHHLHNIKILSEREPSEKELKEMYSYLDYCFVCEKRLHFFNAQSHGFEGQAHKFGCSLLGIIFGVFYRIVHIFILLCLALLISPFYYGYKIFKKIIGAKD